MEKTGTNFASLIAGIALGAAAGILFAPKKGAETQEDIKEGIASLKLKISDMIANGEDLASDKINQVKDKISELEAELKDIVCEKVKS